MKERTPTWYRKKLVAKAKIIAKERDGWKCVKCGKDGRNYKLDGSHVFPEGKYPGMSADPENIKALCFQCHSRWHEHPVESAEWFKRKYPERYRRLKLKSMKPIKINWKQAYEATH